MALQPTTGPGGTVIFRQPDPGRSTSLDVVREAVTRAIRRLAALPGPPVTGWDEVGTVLADLVAALSPIPRTVRALRALDPSGELAAVVDCLAAAAGHLAAGDVGATRLRIAAGAAAMDRYVVPGDV